jgi:tetratricopeptide (TPR) repeat protein
MIELPDELLAALQAVSGALSWEEKGGIIRVHPEVMETRCLLFLTDLMGRARTSGKANAYSVGLLTRTLLERCRSRGVTDSLAELAILIPVDAIGRVTISSGALGRLDELASEEFIDITQRSDLDDLVDARYVIARADEALAMSDDAELTLVLHQMAGMAWRHLMPTEGAAVAGHRALEHLRAALAIVDVDADPASYGDLQNELGLVLLDLPGGDQHGQLNDAVEAFEAALEVRSWEAMPLEWAASMNNLAMALTRFHTHDWVERTERAVYYFGAALEVLAHAGPVGDTFRAHMNLGTAHSKLESIDESHVDRAIEAYTAALALASAEIPVRERAACLINRAGAFSSKAAALEARHDAEAALAIITPGSSPRLFAIAHEIVADTYAQHRPEDGAGALRTAMAHYKRASQAVSVNEEPDIRRRVDRALGDLYLLNGDFESARARYQFALSAQEILYQGAVEEVGRLEQSGTVAGLYDRDAYAHLKCGQFETGLLRLEAGRARWITARLALDHIELGLLPPEHRRTLSDLRVQIAALQIESRANPLGLDPTRRMELTEANRRISELLTEVQASNRAAIPQALTIADFKATIPGGGALVYLVVTLAGGAALVVPHDVEVLGEENVVWLDKLTTGAVDAILRGPGGWLPSYIGSGDQWRQAIVDVSARLWELAMASLHDRLVGLGLDTEDPIVLVPPGGLSVLPLHSAWHIEAGKRRAFADHWTVSYVPSGFSLSISGARAQRADGEGLLIVANPTGDRPGTVDEGDVAQALIQPVTRLQSDATWQAVIDGMPGKRYIHFACHGSYAWSDPLQSKLQLDAGAGVTLADVLSRVDLSQARLVILSACETGLIDLAQSPDDYVGFPAGFLQAGAPAVLSTLWRIDDVTTAALVKHFYHAHLFQDQPPAVALRTALRRLRERPQFDHPYFWAAFIVTGV